MTIITAEIDPLRTDGEVQAGGPRGVRNAMREGPLFVAQARGRWWSLLCLVAIAGACATGARQPSGELTGIEWRLTEVDGAPAVASGGLGGREPHIRLAADSARVTGFTTCNSMFGSYEAAGGGRLRFVQLGSTKMACIEPARAQQEQRLMSALQSVDRYAITGDTLTLYENDRPRTRFVAGQRR